MSAAVPVFRRGGCFVMMVVVRRLSAAARAGLRVPKPGLLLLKLAQRFRHIEAHALEHQPHHRDFGNLLGVNIHREPVRFQVGAGAVGHEQLIHHIHRALVMLNHVGEEKPVELTVARGGKLLKLRLREHARHVVVIVPVPVPVMSVCSCRGMCFVPFRLLLMVFVLTMMMGLVTGMMLSSVVMPLMRRVPAVARRLLHAHMHFNTFEMHKRHCLSPVAQPLLHKRDFILLRIDDAGRKPLHRRGGPVSGRQPRHDERLCVMHNHIGHEVHIGLYKILTRGIEPLPVQGLKLAEVTAIRLLGICRLLLLMVMMTVLRMGRYSGEKQESARHHNKQQTGARAGTEKRQPGAEPAAFRVAE